MNSLNRPASLFWGVSNFYHKIIHTLSSEGALCVSRTLFISQTGVATQRSTVVKKTGSVVVMVTGRSIKTAAFEISLKSRTNRTTLIKTEMTSSSSSSSCSCCSFIIIRMTPVTDRPCCVPLRDVVLIRYWPTVSADSCLWRLAAFPARDFDLSEQWSMEGPLICLIWTWRCVKHHSLFLPKLH